MTLESIIITVKSFYWYNDYNDSIKIQLNPWIIRILHRLLSDPKYLLQIDIECCELMSSRTNQNMRKIEFLEQIQETLLGFTKERKEGRRRIRIG